MKKFKLLTLTLLVILSTCVLFVGCNAKGPMDRYYPDGQVPNSVDGNYDYDSVQEQPFVNAADQAASYFSLDKNTATYSYVRRQLRHGYKIAPDSIRLEEMVNYFDYGYPAPEGDNVVRTTTYLTNCPWNKESKLLTVGVKTKEIKLESVNNNFVFLIDISGSMEGPDRIGLVKYGINKLIDGLSDKDRVSIVTYASGVDVKLESILLTETGKEEVRKVMKNLTASGSTNGSGGIRQAYEIAERQKAEGVNSRVIIMTDGDFNVGISNKDDLKEFIQDKAKSGVYLSVLGYGMGNTRDSVLETLARNGNGNYAYIDCEAEAEKVLTEELSGMLYTVMKDAKAGVTFNADNVKKYRLLGYDTKHISADDFDNENKDTGEIGSNLTVTAMYEIQLNDNAADGAELASIEIRYKNHTKDDINESLLISALNTNNEQDNVKFAACVAEFGLVLRNSSYRGEANLQNVLARLNELENYIIKDVYKIEFRSLVALATDKVVHENL